jgi:ketosteroid isomerase-like protein
LTAANPTAAVPLPDLVSTAVERVLQLADSWLGWDGRPIMTEDGERTYTPHKAIRRTADHLLDHLAEIEGLVAGVEPPPDRWHGSLTTTPADLALFTDADRDEARERLGRLAQLYALRLRALDEQTWDQPRPGHLSIRRIVEHVASTWYADQLGDLLTSNNTTELIRRVYSAFNARDIDEALASIQPDVEWANGWEGGYVQGHDALRDYWTRQWQELDPTVTPVAITVDGDSADVLVDQVVRAADGPLIRAGRVKHRYRVHSGLIARLDITPVD